jgi:hypothetical protein
VAIHEQDVIERSMEGTEERAPISEVFVGGNAGTGAMERIVVPIDYCTPWFESNRRE